MRKKTSLFFNSIDVVPNLYKNTWSEYNGSDGMQHTHSHTFNNENTHTYIYPQYNKIKKGMRYICIIDLYMTVRASLLYNIYTHTQIST